MNIFPRNNFFSLSHQALSPKAYSPLTTVVGVSTCLLALSAPSYAACLANAEEFGFVPKGELQQVTEAHPQVFWKLGEHNAENLQISVSDGEFRELYFWDYKLAASDPEAVTPSVMLMSVQPPSRLATTALEVGDRQTWELTLICDYGDRSQDITLTQEIERVAEDERLENSLTTLTSQERAEVYLTQGLVHNALREFVHWQTHQDTMPAPLSVYERWVDFQKKAGIMESN